MLHAYLLAWCVAVVQHNVSISKSAIFVSAILGFMCRPCFGKVSMCAATAHAFIRIRAHARSHTSSNQGCVYHHKC